MNETSSNPQDTLHSAGGRLKSAIPFRSKKASAWALPSTLVLGAAFSLAPISLQAASASTATLSTAQAQLSSLKDSYVASTVASNGDNNPYGITVVPSTFVPPTSSLIQPGDLLVSDFNNSAGTMGAGSSIVVIHNGVTSTFSQGQVTGTVGIAVNPKSGPWASDIGSNPALNTSNGDVTIFKPTGGVVHSLTNANTLLNPTTPLSETGKTFQGPWGQAFNNNPAAPAFFWTNIEDGTIYRIGPGLNPPTFSTSPITQVATGLATSGTSSATDSGPGSIAYDSSNGTLYVTDSANNTVYAIANANSATGPVTPTIVYQGSMLNAPQGIAINPTNGDLLVVDGAGANNLVEITTTGSVVAVRNLAPSQTPGALFGITATTNAAGQLVIYYVNDNENSVHSLTVPTPAVGIHLVGADGGVFSYGSAGFFGSAATTKLNAPIVVGVSSSSGKGYLLGASDGGVFSYGDAAFYGSMGGTHLNAPVVGMATTADAKGYWLVAKDGGVFSFGDAAFYGSMGAKTLNAPIVGMASTPDGGGYWLVAKDGGVFSFGDAAFYGSMGATTLNAPVVGMASTPDGGGYWLVAKDGGVFSFGDATFYGSMGAKTLNAPVVGMASSYDGAGYALVAKDGGVFTFGDAPFFGSGATMMMNAPIVSMIQNS